MAGHCREIIALVQRLKHERMYLPGQMKVAVVKGTISRVSLCGIIMIQFLLFALSFCLKFPMNFVIILFSYL